MQLAPRWIAPLALLAAACAAPMDATPEHAGQAAIFDADPLFTAPTSGTLPTYPIVLAHGFDGSTTNRWSFNGVADALRDAGFAVHEAEVAPYRAPSVRALELRDHVDDALREFGAAKVHIIAHSMGGLDARELISVLGYGDRVASLTTIASPHRGTAVADLAVQVLPSSGVANDAVNAIASAWALTFTDPALADSDVRGALTALTTDAMTAFNASHPDDARVHYQSWAGVSSLPVLGFGVPGPHDSDACEGNFVHHTGRVHATDLTLRAGQAILGGTSLTPNDGMTTVESAKWGAFRGCVPADHLAEVGQPGRGFDTWTGFDHIAFYQTVAYGLTDFE
jgi:triacylglycerol lipase